MYLCVVKVHTDDVPVRGFLGIAGAVESLSKLCWR